MRGQQLLCDSVTSDKRVRGPDISDYLLLSALIVGSHCLVGQLLEQNITLTLKLMARLVISLFENLHISYVQV